MVETHLPTARIHAPCQRCGRYDEVAHVVGDEFYCGACYSACTATMQCPCCCATVTYPMGETEVTCPECLTMNAVYEEA